ncbi:UNVERIFIED_ORG: hypothetical protein ABIB52_003182 [Arthrobacter sp. UYCu721]
MDPETADVVGHDVTTITCVCGNTVIAEAIRVHWILGAQE